jgi:hypothetical protein
MGTPSLLVCVFPNHLKNILEAMDVAKANELTTVVIRHHQPDPNSPLFSKGSEQWDLHPEERACYFCRLCTNSPYVR